MRADRVEVFVGEICGIGTASGHRFVIGRWPESPYGSFADVMHEAPDGLRTLHAPTDEIAEFVQATYSFDDVLVVPVSAERTTTGLRVDAGELHLRVEFGRRTAVGFALRCVPRAIATSTWWCTLIDPIARVVVRGVRTRGSAGNDRAEWYGATDQHRVVEVHASWSGQDLGALADVWPPVRFGFSSTPRRPSVVSVTTTIEHRVPGTPH